MKKTNKAIHNIDNKISADIVLFFDMDGTLIDSNFANFLSYKKAIYSVTKSVLELSYNANKRFDRNLLKTTIINLTETEYDLIIKEKEDCFKDYLHETKLIKEIAEILLKYSKTNKIVLVSNCRKNRAIATLTHFGLLDKFSNVFCRDIGENYQKNNKFENAIKKLGVLPSFVIAFENEECEIIDAQKAGISIINPTDL